mgnify:FL=1
MENNELKLNLYQVWQKYEDMAMHFNDLIIKVRIQALGGVAAIITVIGFIFKAKGGIPWDIMIAIFGFLLLFWIAIWILDFLYYNKLLLGAIDALLKIEELSERNVNINLLDMSHKIEAAVHGDPPTHRRKGLVWGPILFYSLVVLGLSIGLICSVIKYLHLKNV